MEALSGKLYKSTANLASISLAALQLSDAPYHLCPSCTVLSLRLIIAAGISDNQQRQVAENQHLLRIILATV
jgi:hypothetical protein